MEFEFGGFSYKLSHPECINLEACHSKVKKIIQNLTLNGRGP